MKDCKIYKREINKYIDKELNPDESRNLESHLKECEACKDYLNELKNAISIVKSKEGVFEAPQNIWRKIEQEIIITKKMLWQYIFIPAAAAAVLVMALLFNNVEKDDKFVISCIKTQVSYLDDETLIDDWYFEEDDSYAVDLFFSEEL